MNSSFSPSSFGKLFLIQYGLHISLKQSKLFAKPTSLEIDLNIDSSDLDFNPSEFRKQA